MERDESVPTEATEPDIVVPLVLCACDCTQRRALQTPSCPCEASRLSCSSGRRPSFAKEAEEAGPKARKADGRSSGGERGAQAGDRRKCDG